MGGRRLVVGSLLRHCNVGHKESYTQRRWQEFDVTCHIPAEFFKGLKMQRRRDVRLLFKEKTPLTRTTFARGSYEFARERDLQWILLDPQLLPAPSTKSRAPGHFGIAMLVHELSLGTLFLSDRKRVRQQRFMGTIMGALTTYREEQRCAKWVAFTHQEKFARTMYTGYSYGLAQNAA